MAKKKLSKRRRIARARLILVLCLLALAGVVYLAVYAMSDHYELTNENDPVAVITLSNGKKVTVELFKDEAPATVANFAELANSGFYDGLPFNRIIAGERVQAGDASGDGLGNAGYRIKGEFALNGYENGLSHTKGTLSMARLTGYDTASSQFFIALSDLSRLDGGYAAFGRIVEGMKYIDALSRSASPATIKSIRVDLKGFKYPFEKYAN